MDKSKMRELYIVEDVREENNVKQYLIRKFQNSLRLRHTRLWQPKLLLLSSFAW